MCGPHDSTCCSLGKGRRQAGGRARLGWHGLTPMGLGQDGSTLGQALGTHGPKRVFPQRHTAPPCSAPSPAARAQCGDTWKRGLFGTWTPSSGWGAEGGGPRRCHSCRCPRQAEGRGPVRAEEAAWAPARSGQRTAGGARQGRAPPAQRPPHPGGVSNSGLLWPVTEATERRRLRRTAGRAAPGAEAVEGAARAALRPTSPRGLHGPHGGVWGALAGRRAC